MPSSFPYVNMHVIMPELILVAVASIVLLLDAFLRRVPSRAMAWLSLLGVIFAFIYSLNLWSPAGGMELAFSGMIVRDNFGVFIWYTILLGTGLVLLYSAGYLEKEELVHGEYYGLLLFSAAGMMLLASANDFITVFLGVETLSIGLYVLSGFARTEIKSQESSLKYFLLSSFATAIMVYGVALVYGSTGSTNINSIADYIRDSAVEVNPMFFAGMALVLAGLAFKVALVPFHVWVPDVYEGAPTPVTAFMSFGTKAAAFVALSRVFLGGFGDARGDWVLPMWILAALTMFIGNVVAIPQRNLKRLLAYSSVGHAGYILIGLLAGRGFDVPGISGVSSIAFYLLTYTFLILGALGVVIYLERRGQNLTLDDYAGLWYRHPAPAALMALFMFGLAGIPPTGGFIAKLYVFSAGVYSGFTGLVIIGVLTSVIAVYYYLRVIVYMFMRRPEEQFIPPTRSPEAIAALIIAAAATLFLGIYPTPVLDLARNIIFPGF